MSKPSHLSVVPTLDTKLNSHFWPSRRAQVPDEMVRAELERIKKLPQGCSYQGRHPDREPVASDYIEAAHAASEHDDDQSIPPTRREIYGVMVRPVLLVLLGVPAAVIGLGLAVSFVRGFWP